MFFEVLTIKMSKLIAKVQPTDTKIPSNIEH